MAQEWPIRRVQKSAQTWKTVGRRVALTESSSQLVGSPAYSPDGHSLCCTSTTTIIIWDIQTGGVAKEIQHNEAFGTPLVWSLDGRMISTTSWDLEFATDTWTVHRYDVMSGAALSPVTFQNRPPRAPLLWAHNESFQVMTTGQDEMGFSTLDIFKIGPTPTKIESFQIASCFLEQVSVISFSPTTYYISAYGKKGFFILDLQSLRYLLVEEGKSHSHNFSLDGSLFAASTALHVCV